MIFDVLSSFSQKPAVKTGEAALSPKSENAPTAQNTYKDSLQISQSTLEQIKQLKQNAGKNNRDIARQKLDFLKQRIEMMKMRLRFASGQNLKSLQREYNRMVAEYKNIGKQFGQSGIGGASLNAPEDAPETNAENGASEPKNPFIQLYEENEKRFKMLTSGNTGSEDDEEAKAFKEEMDKVFRELKALKDRLEKRAASFY